MKKTLPKLLILLILSHPPQTLAQNNQQHQWHEPLVKLYYKSTSTQVNQQVINNTIQTFQDLELTSLNDINNIKARSLNKTQLSDQKYELHILRTYYLLTKAHKKQKLKPEEIEQGYQSLTKLYYKGSSQKQQENITNMINNTSIKHTKFQEYAISLAENLQTHTTSIPTQQPSPPITHPNNTKQYHNQTQTTLTSDKKINSLLNKPPTHQNQQINLNETQHHKTIQKTTKQPKPSTDKTYTYEPIIIVVIILTIAYLITQKQQKIPKTQLNNIPDKTYSTQPSPQGSNT